MDEMYPVTFMPPFSPPKPTDTDQFDPSDAPPAAAEAALLDGFEGGHVGPRAELANEIGQVLAGEQDSSRGDCAAAVLLAAAVRFLPLRCPCHIFPPVICCC